jgi:hypothetical protein
MLREGSDELCGNDGGLSGYTLRDLMVEAMESRFGMIHRFPHRIQWLSDNVPAYIARETRSFAQMMEVEGCRTPIQPGIEWDDVILCQDL